MSKKDLKSNLKTALAVFWLAFTLSLVGWWVYFLTKLDGTESIEQMRLSHRMFAWEGSILLGSILIGGVALILFAFRDQRRHQRLRFFFSTFSHDIKTSIARLRLQAEVLEEDSQIKSQPVLKRLIQDIQRLDLQLENSLLLANLESGKLLQEEFSLSQTLSQLRNEFPELSIELEKEAFLRGDRRAFISVLRNLLHNSVTHGKATLLQIKVKSRGSRLLEICIRDNGLGYKGNLSKLGAEILLSQSQTGNGIGLHITRRLIQKMSGEIEFSSQPNEGFQSILRMEGRCS